jgi:hypothetical protein
MIMTYCYAEKTKDGKIDHVVFQDETGVYHYFQNEDSDNGKFIPAYLLDRANIKLPGEKPLTVMTNTRKFLEFVRQCDRGDYTATIPTEIREYDGHKEEVVKVAMKDLAEQGVQ